MPSLIRFSALVSSMFIVCLVFGPMIAAYYAELVRQSGLDVSS